MSMSGRTAETEDAAKALLKQSITIASCQKLDDYDPLEFFRRKFRLSDNIVYLDGNSLGPLPVATPARIAKVSNATHPSCRELHTAQASLTLHLPLGDKALPNQ